MMLSFPTAVQSKTTRLAYNLYKTSLGSRILHLGLNICFGE